MKGNYTAIPASGTIKTAATRTRDGEVKWRIRFGVWAARFPAIDGHLAFDLLIKDECRLVVYGSILVDRVIRRLVTDESAIADLLHAIVLEQNYILQEAKANCESNEH
jgi:hypothetical protein